MSFKIAFIIIFLFLLLPSQGDLFAAGDFCGLTELQANQWCTLHFQNTGNCPLAVESDSFKNCFVNSSNGKEYSCSFSCSKHLSVGGLCIVMDLVGEQLTECQYGCNPLTEECDPPPPGGQVCGNGIQEGIEECDDGNTVSGDGCDSNCKIETSSSSQQSIYKNPLVWNDIIAFIWGAIMYLFGHAIVLVVLFLLIGAYVLATSGGSPQKIKLGKDIIIWAIIGYVIMLLARGIINFIWDFIRST